MSHTVSVGIPVDNGWIERLPAFAAALLSGGLVMCAACQHYRSEPDISALGKCSELKTDAWAFAPFECKSFRSLASADVNERWLAQAIGGRDAVEALAGYPERATRATFLRELAGAKGALERTVGTGTRRQTIKACLNRLYGATA